MPSDWFEVLANWQDIETSTQTLEILYLPILSKVVDIARKYSTIYPVSQSTYLLHNLEVRVVVKVSEWDQTLALERARMSE